MTKRGKTTSAAPLVTRKRPAFKKSFSDKGIAGFSLSEGKPSTRHFSPPPLLHKGHVLIIITLKAIRKGDDDIFNEIPHFDGLLFRDQQKLWS